MGPSASTSTMKYDMRLRPVMVPERFTPQLWRIPPESIRRGLFTAAVIDLRGPGADHACA